VLATLTGNGGVCMVTFVPSFVSEDCREFVEQVRADMLERAEDPRDWSLQMAATARYAAAHARPKATVQQVADHVEHVRAVAGLEHVGIGGDYDGCDELPVGLEDVTGYPALIAELADRGWSEPELAALTGENVLRVMADAHTGRVLD
jgi:membrane dipeptidase